MDRKELLTKIVGLNNSAHNILFIVKDMVVREVKEILNERGQFFEFSSSFFPQVVSGGDTICYVHRIFWDDETKTINVVASFDNMVRDKDVECQWDEIDLDGQISILKELVR